MLETDFIPARSTGSTRLMVVLHGLGDSIEGYRWLPEVLALPWLNYLLVNAPDEYFGGLSWYDFAGDPGTGVRRSYRLLSELLEEQEKRGFPAEQLLLFGFSQGALMTIETGLRYPRRLAGCIGISGYIFEPEKLLMELSPAAREQRFLITHGTQDALIPLAPVRAQVASLKAAGIRIAWHELVKPHTIDGKEEMRLVRAFVLESYSGG